MDLAVDAAGGRADDPVASPGRGGDPRALEAVGALAHAHAGLGGPHREFLALLALAARDPSGIRAFVDGGGDPDARGERGDTVLMAAARWDDAPAAAAIQALAEAGAEMDAASDRGTRALDAPIWRDRPKVVAALIKGGADPDLLDNRGRTALQRAASIGSAGAARVLLEAGADVESGSSHVGTPLQLATGAASGALATIRALAEAGADPDARDYAGRTAMHLAVREAGTPWNRRNGALALAALIEAGADVDASDDDGMTPLRSASVAGHQGTMALLQAVGARWVGVHEPRPDHVNARFLAVELFQGPMVRTWKFGRDAGDPGSLDYATPVLDRPVALAVRIGSEDPDRMPELSVRLVNGDAEGPASETPPVRGPDMVGLASGVFETEYVYELPRAWSKAGSRAVLSIDPRNRLDETDETDNTATLTMDGSALPVFDVTFVPVVFDGAEPPDVDAEAHVSVVVDLLPIAEHRARVGRPLDLSGRNLGVADVESSRRVALRELLHRWNSEAREHEYYHGLLVVDGDLPSWGFGGLAYQSGNVAVSDIIPPGCPVEREPCTSGIQAHEIGHNLGLDHAPGDCGETEPIDQTYPYADAHVGPRRGWLARLDEFVNRGDGDRYFDVMSYCNPRFVSDYNYGRMVDLRLDGAGHGASVPGRKRPTLRVGPAAYPAVAPPDVAATSETRQAQSSATALAGESPRSIAITGVVDESGNWSVVRIGASRQPPRSPPVGGKYLLTLQDAYQRETYRERIGLLRPAHGSEERG
ncbi:MAG: hypothetical protein OXQ28_09205, partial [Acidobacteriota bacterium]|nr:hypothetical protein [Acidobacteriota bacterium]